MADDGKLINPALLQRYLHGMRYPARRKDLLGHVHRHTDRILGVLERLPDREYRGPTDVSKAFGELARQYLNEASYPARRDDLVAEARGQGADEVVIDALLLIPDLEYSEPDAVIIEVVGVE